GGVPVRGGVGRGTLIDVPRQFVRPVPVALMLPPVFFANAVWGADCTHAVLALFVALAALVALQEGRSPTGIGAIIGLGAGCEVAAVLGPLYVEKIGPISWGVVAGAFADWVAARGPRREPPSERNPSDANAA